MKMANSLKLQGGGQPTFDFDANGLVLIRYKPEAPPISESELNFALKSGGEIPRILRRNIKEPITLYIPATLDPSAITQSLERFFLAAENRQALRKGPKVYILFTATSGDLEYRSELFYGQVKLTETSMETIEGGGTIITIEIRRRFYWELNTLLQLPLTNRNGSNITNGLTLYNHTDGGAGHDNWATIAAGDIGGNIPAPVLLEYQNTTNDSSRISEIRTTINRESAPTTFTHILEGEARATGGTITADASASNGNYVNCSAIPINSTELLKWDLSSALLDAAGTNIFRPILRLANWTDNDVWLKWVIRFDVSTIYESPEFFVGNVPLVESPAFHLPPYANDLGANYPLTLHLYGRSASGAGFIYLDFVQLSPMDGYRVLTPKGYGTPYNQSVVDDGIEEALYVNTGSQKQGIYISYGQLMLEPNRVHRIIVLVNTMTNGSTPDRTLKLKAWFRPRRLTI